MAAQSPRQRPIDCSQKPSLGRPAQSVEISRTESIHTISTRKTH
ncbi:hypothetical protein SynMINOS11_02112 [Synechococcus sp. Minos11]|nr:hypothetical protein SynMINOS11_02112 [Synechococcus sp. Minos11]